MTAKSKTSAVHSSVTENYFRKAREYRDSMNQALADRRPNAAALNGIHCAISAELEGPETREPPEESPLRPGAGGKVRATFRSSTLERLAKIQHEGP